MQPTGDQSTGQGTGDGQPGTPPNDQGSTGQTGNAQRAGQTGAQGTLGPDGKPWDPEAQQRTITAQRISEAEAVKQAKALARERDELKARLDELDAAKLSDTEKLTKQVAELTERLAATEAARRQTAIKAAVLVEATSMGLIDPDGALLMLPSVGAVEIDEAGEPTNVPALLGLLVKAKPYLKKPDESAAAAATTGNGTSGKPPLERIPPLPKVAGTGNLPTESADEQALRDRAFARNF